MEAVNRDDSSDCVLLATKSLTVHTSMTTTNAATGFIGASSSAVASSAGNAVSCAEQKLWESAPDLLTLFG